MNVQSSTRKALLYSALPTTAWGLLVAMLGLAAFTWLVVAIAAFPDGAGWGSLCAGAAAFVVIFVPATLARANGKTVSHRLVAWHYGIFLLVGAATVIVVAETHSVLIGVMVAGAQTAYVAGLTVWTVSQR